MHVPLFLVLSARLPITEVLFPPDDDGVAEANTRFYVMLQFLTVYTKDEFEPLRDKFKTGLFNTNKMGY